jgi:hypothetical protein
MLLLAPIGAPAQQKPLCSLAPDTLPNARRTAWLLGGTGALYAGTYAYLGAIWYQGTALSGFHWHNDWYQWQQIDKVGHAYGAYQESRVMMHLLDWAGHDRSAQLLWGGMAGFLMQSPVELLDGFAQRWGASWHDLAFNAVGSGVAVANEALWQEQRLMLKYSFWPTDLARQNRWDLGRGATMAIKDYNGQTYWLGTRLTTFLPPGQLRRAIPDWLALSIGYGGHGMIGRYDKDPRAVIREREYRQFYLGLDLDLTQIPTDKRGLKLLLGVLNAIRLPLPAIEFSEQGTRFRPLMF